MAILDNIRLDFQVLNTGDPKILAIIDTSVWGFIEDKVAAIEIILPGSEKVKRYTYIKNKTNIFNSSNLQRSPVGVYNDLPDGIYKIDIIGAHKNCFHRDFLKTDKVRTELAEIYISLGFDNDKSTIDKKKKIQDFELLIRAAENSAKLGKLKKAMSYFKKVVQYVKDYNECETCN